MWHDLDHIDVDQFLRVFISRLSTGGKLPLDYVQQVKGSSHIGCSFLLKDKITMQWHGIPRNP